jgi:hypothetical protein
LEAYFFTSDFGCYLTGYGFFTYCFGCYFTGCYLTGSGLISFFSSGFLTLPAVGLAASTSTSKSGLPTSKLSPALTCNFETKPVNGLLISTVTLSVSILATV